MKHVKLTALQHSDFEKVKDVICKGNMVYIIPRPDLDKFGKAGEHAYEVICKGVSIGFIPLLSTLRGYWKDAVTKDGQEAICKWGVAVEALRHHLDSQVKYQMKEEIIGKVCELLYLHQGEYTTKERGVLSQVAIGVEGVE